MTATCFPWPGKDGIILLLSFSSAQVSHVTAENWQHRDFPRWSKQRIHLPPSRSTLEFSSIFLFPGALASALFGFTFSDVHRELFLPAVPEADRVLPSSEPPSRPGPANSNYTPTNLIRRNTGAVNHGGRGSSSVIPKVKMGGCRL